MAYGAPSAKFYHADFVSFYLAVVLVAAGRDGSQGAHHLLDRGKGSTGRLTRAGVSDEELMAAAVDAAHDPFGVEASFDAARFVDLGLLIGVDQVRMPWAADPLSFVDRGRSGRRREDRQPEDGDQASNRCSGSRHPHPDLPCQKGSGDAGFKPVCVPRNES